VKRVEVRLECLISVFALKPGIDVKRFGLGECRKPERRFPFGTRERVIDRTPHLTAYRIYDDRVRILRVLHEAQNWPPILPTH